MRNAIRIFTRTALAAGVVALAMSTSANAELKKYTFGYDQPHSTAYGIAADMFNAKLMELSKGTMGIDQFPGAQLGQEPVMLEKIRTGDIDFIITATANAASVAPQAGVFSEHFIFRDKEPPDARAGRSGGDQGIRGDDQGFGQGRACDRPDDHGHA